LYFRIRQLVAVVVRPKIEKKTGPDQTGPSNTSSQGEIVLCVASSGIASLLLIGGRNSHSIFKIPIEIHDSSTCAIPRNSDLAELIRSTDLVIWDEAPMQHHHIHEAVDRTFQNIHRSDKPFGGLTIVFGGDFKQILPVIVKSSLLIPVFKSLTYGALSKF
jgi:hypothetical protein